MVRPTLLVVEPEPEQALSARKLVLESGKFNVITAHSGREFFEMLRRFPLVDCAIIHGEIDDVSCHEMCAAVKKTSSRIATVFITPKLASTCRGADHVISSHQPETLLTLVRRHFDDDAYDADSLGERWFYDHLYWSVRELQEELGCKSLPLLQPAPFVLPG